METPGITSTFSGNVLAYVYLQFKSTLGFGIELYFDSFVCPAGLNLLPGCKRKPSIESVDQRAATPMSYDNSANPENLEKPKRARQMHHKGNSFPDSDLYVSASEMCPVDSPVDSPNDVGRPSLFGCLQSPPSLGCLQTPSSACAVEDCLSKGFEGHLLSMAVFSSTVRADCHTHNFLQVQKSLTYAM